MVRIKRQLSKHNIPTDLANEINTIIQEMPEFGYRSVDDFITDSSRRRIEIIKSNKREELKKLIEEWKAIKK